MQRLLDLLLEPHMGVNPRGLIPGKLWQMDVTHNIPFGKLNIFMCLLTPAVALSEPPYKQEKPPNMLLPMFSPVWRLHHNPRSLKWTMARGMLAPALNNFVLRWALGILLASPVTPKAKVL